jgi:hypothetical protein
MRSGSGRTRSNFAPMAAGILVLLLMISEDVSFECVIV